MKVLQTEISPDIKSYVSVSESDRAFFNAPLHYHYELEMVYILEGRGKRIIGDNVNTYNEGDLFFIGSNLPHVWLNGNADYKENTLFQSRAIVIYFNRKIFSSEFYEMAEAAKINELCSKAVKGIAIKGNTKALLETKIKALLHKEDFEKVICFFEMIHILSQSDDISFIAGDNYTARLPDSRADRLSDVYQYVRENFKDNISLNTIAGISNLTPQSFCRLFKKKTGKHFVEYVNEIRIGEACKYLLDTDWTISEIAYHSGFKTVSNFNKLFKSITGVSPKIYKARPK